MRPFVFYALVLQFEALAHGGEGETVAQGQAGMGGGIGNYRVDACRGRGNRTSPHPILHAADLPTRGAEGIWRPNERRSVSFSFSIS